MHRFFTIYDMVENVLQHLDSRDYPRAAVVCMMWYNIAMDLLWEKVDFRIFSCLGQLERLSYRWNYLVRVSFNDVGHWYSHLFSRSLRAHP